MVTEFVTREEFDVLKAEHERVAIRAEVLSEVVTELTRQLADLREEMNARFDAVDSRFDAVDSRFDAVDSRFAGVDDRLSRLEKLVMDGNAALMSAILKLGKP